MVDGGWWMLRGIVLGIGVGGGWFLWRRGG